MKFNPCKPHFLLCLNICLCMEKKKLFLYEVSCIQQVLDKYQFLDSSLSFPSPSKKELLLYSTIHFPLSLMILKVLHNLTAPKGSCMNISSYCYVLSVRILGNSIYYI